MGMGPIGMKFRLGAKYEGSKKTAESSRACKCEDFVTMISETCARVTKPLDS